MSGMAAPQQNRSLSSGAALPRLFFVRGDGFYISESDREAEAVDSISLIQAAQEYRNVTINLLTGTADMI